MTKGLDTRVNLAALEIGYIRPTLVVDLLGGWRRRVRNRAGEEFSHRDELDDYLGEVVGSVLKEVQAEAIVRATLEATSSMMQADEFELSSLIDAGDASFSGDHGPVDAARLRGLARKAYVRLDEIPRERKSISRALVIVRRGDDVLKDLERTLTAFVLDTRTASEAFTSVKDREQSAKSVCNEVAAWRGRLASVREELFRIDESGKAERETILRSLATLTQFIELQKLEVYSGLRTQNPPVPITRMAGGSSFSNGGVQRRQIDGG